MSAIGQLHGFLKLQGRYLLISGVEPAIGRVLARSGLAVHIGAENIFAVEENPTLATKKALRRAQTLIGVKTELRVFHSHDPAGAH